MIPQASVQQHERLAYESLVDTVVIERAITAPGTGGRAEQPTGQYDLIETTVGRVGLVNSADPAQITIAARAGSRTTQLLFTPVDSLIEAGHRVTVTFRRLGGSRVLKVLGVLPRTTHATLTRSVCEEIT